MDKWNVAKVLEEIADYLDIADGNQFKAMAYRKAARRVEAIPGDDLGRLVTSGEIRNLEGIGKATAAVITEAVTTGRSAYLDELRAQYPPGILDLLGIQGLGAKRIVVLHDELGITSVEELEEACRNGRVAAIKGFGKKTADKILAGIELLRSAESRVLLPVAIDTGERLRERIAGIAGVEDVTLCGQIRRRLEIVDEVVVCIAAANPERVATAIAGSGAIETASRSDSVVRGRGPDGVAIAVHVVPPEAMAVAVFALTGSEEFLAGFADAAPRTLSLEGFKFNRNGRPLDLDDEDAIFDAAGLSYVEPELRESSEDVTPRRKRSRALVEEGDLRGTFHVHTTYSDGRATLREMLDTAKQRGLTYVGISDHSQAAAYAGGLTRDRIEEQRAELETERRRLEGLTIFHGTEADILRDGSVDYDEATLKRFDFVVASVHSRFKMNREEMTDRIVRALANPYVTFLGHMTGRLLLSRPEYEIDLDAVFDAAAEHGVMIEINGSPHRLDIDWRLIRRAAARGIVFSIHPDAHSTREMGYLTNGTWVARKGGLAPEQIFNTRPVEEVAEVLRARRERART